MTDAALPPAAPDVVAAAVESLTSRLRRKLDATVAQYATVPVTVTADGTLTIPCGEDTTVTLHPGPHGTITDPSQATCTCLLAPRCLHRAAVLTACPLADPPSPETSPPTAGASPQGEEASSGLTPGGSTGGLPEAGSPSVGASPDAGDATSGRRSSEGDAVGRGGSVGVGADGVAAGDGRTGGGAQRRGAHGGGGHAGSEGGDPVARGVGDGRSQDGSESGGLKPAQVAAAAGLLEAAAAVLAAGVPAAGAVPQAELLRAAHTARLAGLYRAEAAALRVVRGLRSVRARHEGHRLADLTDAMRELLLTTTLLADARPDPALVGIARRAYQPGGSLRVHGVCREPVISATGYGGVVTHLLAEDGRWYSIADVKPGGAARARGAATAPVSLGGAVLDHARLARGGLLVTGATVSPDGRLGAGKGVRATPLPGVPWSPGPASLFGRPLAEAVADRLSADPGADPEHVAAQARHPVGCDLVIVGPSGDHVLARALDPAAGPDGWGPLIRLTPANGHPDLAHVANLRQLAERPGLRIRVVGRPEPDRAATLSPLAVGPVPDGTATLRLPDEWQGHADLGYDSLQGAHFPPAAELTPPPPVPDAPDLLAAAPLWRVRRLVELAVAGGRRAVAESARGGGFTGHATALRHAGFRTAAELAATLGSEADRRTRDVFGRLNDPDPRRFATAWLATAVHLTVAERTLIRATWR